MERSPDDTGGRSRSEADEAREEASAPSSQRATDWSAWTATLRDITPYLDLGWRIMGAAAGPPVIGYAADAGLDTSPWGLLVGCGLGLLGAAVQLVRLGEEFGRRAP
jgi:hypothetical protein